MKFRCKHIRCKWNREDITSGMTGGFELDKEYVLQSPYRLEDRKMVGRQSRVDGNNAVVVGQKMDWKFFCPGVNGSNRHWNHRKEASMLRDLLRIKEREKERRMINWICSPERRAEQWRKLEEKRHVTGVPKRTWVFYPKEEKLC